MKFSKFGRCVLPFSQLFQNPEVFVSFFVIFKRSSYSEHLFSSPFCSVYLHDSLFT
nr:MAG TPA: hypothetical protein [Caudoviricetes sp.]